MELDENERLVIRGFWRYGETTRVGILIACRPIWYGTGDHEDPPEDSDDRKMETYALKYEIAGSPGSYADGGQFPSLAEAIQAAETLCGSTVNWE